MNFGTYPFDAPKQTPRKLNASVGYYFLIWKISVLPALSLAVTVSTIFPLTTSLGADMIARRASSNLAPSVRVSVGVS